MKWISRWLTALAASAVAWVAPADTLKPIRHIKVSWQARPDATGYELEVTRREVNPNFEPLHRKVGQVTEDIFDLLPGSYFLKIRAIDPRHVPGPWGETKSVEVAFPEVKNLTPTNNSVFSPDASGKTTVKFHWSEYDGATAYMLKIWDRDGNLFAAKKVLINEENLSLDEGHEYQWIVTAMDANGNTGDEPVAKMRLLVSALSKGQSNTPPNSQAKRKIDHTLIETSYSHSITFSDPAVKTSQQIGLNASIANVPMIQSLWLSFEFQPHTSWVSDNGVQCQQKWEKVLVGVPFYLFGERDNNFIRLTPLAGMWDSAADLETESNSKISILVSRKPTIGVDLVAKLRGENFDTKFFGSTDFTSNFFSAYGTGAISLVRAGISLEEELFHPQELHSLTIGLMGFYQSLRYSADTLASPAGLNAIFLGIEFEASF